MSTKIAGREIQVDLWRTPRRVRRRAGFSTCLPGLEPAPVAGGLVASQRSQLVVVTGCLALDASASGQWGHGGDAHALTRLSSGTTTKEKFAMTDDGSPTRIELAHRSSSGLDVTLVWIRDQGVDETLVCVSDTQDGAYFEIPTEPYLALEVFEHPFAYRNFSNLDVGMDRAA